MKYEEIGKDLFIEHRKNFRELLKPRSIAIFHSNDIMPTSADGTMPFIQQSDIFWMSGIDQERSILVVCPDFPEEHMREILFVTRTNEEIAIWEGHKYTKEEATATSGVETIMWLDAFEKTLPLLMAESDHVYLNTNEHRRANVEAETRDARFIKQCRERWPLHEYERANPLMHKLRAVKQQREVEMIEQACHITEQGFRRVLAFVKPGVWEYEVEAEYIHEFVRRRSRGFAYTPIVAGGANACVLHYIENSRQLQDGDLLLMDVGAEYGNYNADMTRTIPVNGRFTERQRAVYSAVLRVQKESYKMLTPGNNIPDYHKEVGKIMTEELIGLGLLDKTDVKNEDPKNPAYRKYFMHGTSHHLGLDVHDYGNWYTPMAAGNVFTVEPGIYIQEEGIGIRLENDVVVTDNGVVDLMANIPIEPDEIEDIMNS